MPIYIVSSYKATATTEFIIIIQSKRGNSNIIYNVSTMLREINKTMCSIWKLA
jgi:hypothetical protein